MPSFDGSTEATDQTVLLVDDLVCRGSEESVSTFLREFGDAADEHGTVSRLIADRQPAARLLGCLKHLMLMANGQDLLAANRLGLPLLKWLCDKTSYIDQMIAQTPIENPVGPALQNACQAAFSTCQYSLLERLLMLVKDTSGIESLQGYWAAKSIEAEMLMRRYEFDAASAVLDSVPPPFQQLPRYQTVSSELSGLRTFRYEVDPPLRTAEKARNVWEGALRDMRASIDQYYQDVPSASTDMPLRRLASIADQMEATLQTGCRFDELKLRMARLTDDYAVAARDLLGSSANDDFSLDTVNRTVSEIELKLDDGSVNELDELRERLERLINLATAAGDRKSVSLLLWCDVLVAANALSSVHPERQYADKGVHFVTLAACVAASAVRLVDSLSLYQTSIDNLEYKASIVNSFPGITNKLFDALGNPLNLEAIFKAAEFTKGRSLLALRASSEAQLEVDSLGAGALGDRVHYLGVGVNSYADEVYTYLYCSDGRLSAKRLPIAATKLRILARDLNPKTWRATGPYDCDPRTQERLSGLLELVEVAQRSGSILPGDHLCISPDDVVFLVPFAYLQVNGKMLIEFVSLSTVASFADARRIHRSKPVRPSSSNGVFVTKHGERNTTDKLARFHTIARAISVAGLQTRFENCTHFTHSSVMTMLQDAQLIHFDTHGYFRREGNPLVESGLLISDGPNAPHPGGARQHLLAPVDLLKTELSLSGSHITLNSCVSGLALSGQGGDLLGLEFALRYKGADSVLATHWDVDGQMSHLILLAFYTHWLGAGLTRARALQLACLDAFATTSHSQNPASYCFFSLHGDWR